MHIYKFHLPVLVAFFASLTLLGSAASFAKQNPGGKERIVIALPIALPGATPLSVGQMPNWLARAGFDVAGIDRRRGTVELIADRNDLTQLSNMGLQWSERIGAAYGPDPRYLKPDDVQARLMGLNRTYPTLTRVERVGTSLQGRPIWGMLISTTPSANDPAIHAKPTFVLDGLHHAREIMTPEVVMDAAEELLKGMATQNPIDGWARGALASWNVWVVPMVNVDGSNIVWTSDNYWRKNARADQKARPHGVDINRNYPYRWGSCDGSSNSKGAQDYRGTAPASEPETQGMVAFFTRVRPAAALSYHSYSEFVLAPIGCKDDPMPNRALVDRVGSAIAKLLISDQGSGTYTYGDPTSLLYPVDGDSATFEYETLGTLAFVLEINTDFQPPYALRDPTVRKQRPAWKYLMQEAYTNMLGVRVVNNGTPVPSSIRISTAEGQLIDQTMVTNEGGYAFKVLDPGHYLVEAKTKDGRYIKAAVEMKGKPNGIVLER